MSLGAVLAAWLLLATSAAPDLVDETPLDRAVREVAQSLRCAVCQNENVYDSNSQLAQQMRDLIRERLARGESPEAVKAYFVSKYGDYILLEPRKQGLNWILWLLPFAGLGAGALLLLGLLVRWRRATQEPPSPPPDPSLRRKLEQELRELED